MPLIALENISRIYKTGQVSVTALKNVNLKVEKGEFISIMGPSGSGKSTLLNIIGCLDRPSTGTYLFSGKHVEKLGDGKLADIRNRYIGFVFQSFHLLSDLDAQGNVELPLIYRGMGRKERQKRAIAALEAVGLSERRKHRPSELSGGEQQRVAIARALVGEPAMILADEPTGALDSVSGQIVMSIFQRLNKERGITIIQVTHAREIAQYAQRVIYLRDGEIEREENLPPPLAAGMAETDNLQAK